MKLDTTKTIYRPRLNHAAPCRVLTIAASVMCTLLGSGYKANAATVNQTLCLRTVDNKTMHDGQAVTFWGYTRVPDPTLAKPSPTCSDAGVGQIPGPEVAVGVGDTLNLTLSLPMGMMGAPMWPMEPAPYMGHTIHMHGADVPTIDDGVPDTSTAVGGMGNPSSYIYHWTPSAEMSGTYMYHCHVHTVKHLEMGMYGSMIVRPINAKSTGPADRYLNQLTPDAATTYDFVQTYLFSTVDPAYHAADAVGDAPVFADYNPKYFLLNGKESIAISNGVTLEVAAETLVAAQNKKVALRLIGLHSVKGTFSIRDKRDGTGNAKPFTIYVQDGRQYPTPEIVTRLDIGPAQRFDIIFTTPATGTGTWYPQFEYQKLRDVSPGGAKAPYATVFGQVTF